MAPWADVNGNAHPSLPAGPSHHHPGGAAGGLAGDPQCGTSFNVLTDLPALHHLTFAGLKVAAGAALSLARTTLQLLEHMGRDS
jgi:hypothetical protein